MIGPREQLDVGLPGDSQTNGMTANRMHYEPATAIKRESTGVSPEHTHQFPARETRYGPSRPLGLDGLLMLRRRRAEKSSLDLELSQIRLFGDRVAKFDVTDTTIIDALSKLSYEPRGSYLD
jgi:hypothetical protein